MKKLILALLLSFTGLIFTVEAQRPIIVNGYKYVATGYDSDAQAFFTATGISDNTIKDAVNTFVLGLKTDGLWTKGKGIYPIVGGTSTTHKYNLKDPRDLDAAYRLAFTGTITHSANGMVGDGSTGYGNTFINPNTVYPTTGLMSLGIYSRTNVDEVRSEIGATSGSTNYCQIYARLGNAFYGQINNVNVSQSITNLDSRGWHFVSRTGATDQFLQKNATQTTFSGGTQALGMVNNNIFVLAQSNTSGSPALYSTKQLCFIWVGDSLNSTEAGNLYTRIQTLETALLRQF